MTVPYAPYDGPIISREEAIAKGLKRYFTGKPCRNGHIHTRWTSSKHCIQCRDVGEQKRIQAKRKELSENAVWFVSKNAPIVQRHEARSTGAKWFFDGRACLRGHVDEKRTVNKQCRECERILYEARRESEEHKRRRRARDMVSYHRNHEKMRNKNAAYRETASAKLAKRARGKLYRSDPTNKITNAMRSAVQRALRGGKRGAPWEYLVGFSIEKLKVHLERQFKKGMTWSNFGKWHIDHIVPLAAFSYIDYTDPEFRAAWAITNLRPAWATDNISKGARRVFLI